MARILRQSGLALVSGAIFAVVMLGAGGSGSIGGVVKNQAGEPVTGALVKVANTERGVAFTVISQDRGRYRATDLPSGKYTVQSFGGGWQSASSTVDVNGAAASLDLSLSATADFRKTAAMSEFATLMPEGEAKTLIVSLCTDCHKNGLQEILFSRKTRDGWDETIAKMRNHPYGNARSLDLFEPQKDAILEYLVQNYGPDAPPLDMSKMPKTLIKGAAAKSVITEFNLPKGANAHDVAVDSKGIAWIAEGGHGIIGRFDPQTISYTRITIPGDKAGATAITTDSQDRVWFGDGTNSRIGLYDPKSSQFTFYQLPVSTAGERKNLNTIRFHPDGTIWATEISSNAIVHLDPATKKVSEYPVPAGVALNTNVNPYGMAIDGAKYVWFAERRSDKVAKVDPKTAEITEFDVPTKGAVLRRMAADNQGNLWFGEFGGVGKLAMVDYKTGKITEYATPTKYSGAYSVDMDRKRNLIWVNEMMADQIARFDPRTKTFVEYPVPTRDSSIRRIEADPSRPNRVWFSGLNVDTVGFVDVVE